MADYLRARILIGEDFDERRLFSHIAAPEYTPRH